MKRNEELLRINRHTKELNSTKAGRKFLKAEQKSFKELKLIK